MANSRKNQKQIWSDRDFAVKLDQINAKRLLLGKPSLSTHQLTKKMLECESFMDLEFELLNENSRKKSKRVDFRIKFDKGFQ